MGQLSATTAKAAKHLSRLGDDNGLGASTRNPNLGGARCIRCSSGARQKACPHSGGLQRG